MLAAVVAAAASATSSNPPPPQQPAYASPGAGPGAQPALDPSYTPCEHACGQVARCDVAPYEVCLAQCRYADAEQQQGGPELLHVVAQTPCAQIEEAMQQAVQSGGTFAPPPS